MLWQPVNLTALCPADSQLTTCSSFGYVYLNLLVQLFGDSKDRRIQEKLGIEDEEDKILENIERCSKRDEYDFIVVGAGSAGCVVANRLSANNKWKVLLLEAGMEQPDVTLVPSLWTVLTGSNVDWKYSTEPFEGSCLAQPGGRCYWPRGKVMGGSSSINGLVYIRGNKADYDEWAELGNEGWSYKEVLTFFKKIEKSLDCDLQNSKYHGVNGEQTVSRYSYIDKPSTMMADAMNEKGILLTDVNAERQLGVMQSQSTSKYGRRMSTNFAFIQPIRYKRKNLTVRVNSEVVKVLIDNNNKAYGVKYFRNGKVFTAFAKKEVIVSGGAVNSPKLLMLSGIGPKEHLSKLNIPVKQNLSVGENLQDHVSFTGLPISLPNGTATFIPTDEILKEIVLSSEMDRIIGPLASNGPVTTPTFLKSDPNLPAPDIEIQVFGVILEEYLNNPVTFEPLEILFRTAFYDGMIPVPTLLTPKSRGMLKLNATNPHGPPLIHANYFQDPDDLVPLVKATKFLLSLENTRAFKSRGAHFVKRRMGECKDYSWGTEEYIVCLARRHTLAFYHPVGTCKMGPKWDKKAVVDPRLRVYGITGLRVIDASIMPVLIRGNTNGPSIMIGEKGVSFILDDWIKK